MKIDEVNTILIKPRNGLIGFASLVINDALYLGSIGIHQRLNGNGYRLTYPTKKTGENNMDIFHPINREAGKAIETAIFNKLIDVMKRIDDVGYDCNFFART
jgi:DNA-binding cell septation regulator SpoVG